MRLKPVKERYHGLNIYTCEPQAKSVARNGIELYYFEEVPVNGFMSQAEYFVNMTQKNELPPFDYYVDFGSVWANLCSRGTSWKIVLIGEKAKSRAMKFLYYLIKDNDIKMENIVLHFEDRDFIKKFIRTVRNDGSRI